MDQVIIRAGEARVAQARRLSDDPRLTAKQKSEALDRVRDELLQYSLALRLQRDLGGAKMADRRGEIALDLSPLARDRAAALCVILDRHSAVVEDLLREVNARAATARRAGPALLRRHGKQRPCKGTRLDGADGATRGVAVIARWARWVTLRGPLRRHTRD